MVISLVAVGNSRGIRIPKAILDHLGAPDKLELDVEGDRLVLTPVVSKPREDWEDAFSPMSIYGDDTLLMGDENSDGGFDWEW